MELRRTSRHTPPVPSEDASIWSIRKGLDEHADTCPLRPEAILVHPATRAKLGWDQICGLPVVGDDAVPAERFRVKCEGSSHGIEDQTTLWVLDAIEQADSTAPTAPRQG